MVRLLVDCLSATLLAGQVVRQDRDGAGPGSIETGTLPPDHVVADWLEKVLTGAAASPALAGIDASQ